MNSATSLDKFIKDNKRVCIYGLGHYAHAVLRILKSRNVVIEAFIISDGESKADTHAEGIPVYAFTEWKKQKCIDSIIIGVAMPNQKMIRDALIENGINNIYGVSELDLMSATIGIMDTRIAVENHGNDIIMDSVNDTISKLFPYHFQFKLPFLDELSGMALNYAMKSEIIFVGGTNALCSHMEYEPNFGVSRSNCKQLEGKIVLAGVGWYQYQEDPDELTIELLRRVLSKKYIHSVRDNYTKEKLQKIGIKNVINTGCLTTWRLDEDLCRRIPVNKGRDAIVMFTPGRWKQDKKIMDVIKENYDKIYFWPQGPTDATYIKAMNEHAILINSNLQSLDDFLLNHESVDYIGTRLHGGIRCLQKGKRSFIFSIDNRAKEMGRDWGLPIFTDEDIPALSDIVNRESNIKINIPYEEIAEWKRQFHGSLND